MRDRIVLILVVCVLLGTLFAGCVFPGTATIIIRNRSDDIITQVYTQREGSADLVPKLHSTTGSADIDPDDNHSITGVSPDTYDVWVVRNGDFDNRTREETAMVVKENTIYTITVR